MKLTKADIIQVAQWLRDNSLVADTETTGLGQTDTVVELAVVDPMDRTVKINTLVKPLSYLSDEAAAIHGITAAELESKGRDFGFVMVDLNNLLTERQLTAFNRPFDLRLIHQSAYAAGVRPVIPETPANTPVCIMELANRYFADHLQWDYSQSKFKRLSLKACLDIAGIQFEGEAHRALADALAASDLLNFIADGK